MNPHEQRQNIGAHPLPAAALALLDAVPPRLAAHLILVHDAAARIIDGLQQHDLGDSVDTNAVLWGAATHDIGKLVHPNELSGPGNDHEAAGETLLLASGIDPALARFARTHGDWQTQRSLEDWLVTLADTCWRGVRNSELEQQIVGALAQQTGRDWWDVFIAIDTMVEQIAADADGRLAWQAQYGVE